jgi:hypothetical protein
MSHPSCGIYSIVDDWDLQDLRQRVDTYEQKTSDERLAADLLITTEEVKATDRGLSFRVDYDYPHRVVDRGQERWVRATHSATVRFVKDLLSDGFFVFDSKARRDSTAGRVAGVLDRAPDDCNMINIPPRTISGVLDADSDGSIVKMWENVDQFTDTASVQGRVDDSTYSYQFDRTGNATYAMFVSRYADRTVGLSSNGLVFYGEEGDDVRASMEQYFFTHIRDRLPD